jgi:hypothetical protein
MRQISSQVDELVVFLNRQRRQTSGVPLRVVCIARHAALTGLRAWGKDQGLQVMFASVGGEVDVLLRDWSFLPIASEQADLVIMDDVLARAETFWEFFSEALRVVSPGGFLIVSTGTDDTDAVPVETLKYALLPESMAALARFGSCHLLASWIDSDIPDRPLWAIFKKNFVFSPSPGGTDLPKVGGAVSAGLMPSVDRQPMAKQAPTSEGDAEITRGAVPYLDVLAWFHRYLAPDLYLEIGVRNGRSLALARARAIGIDPAADIQCALPDYVRVVNETSDQFFDNYAEGMLHGDYVDFAFIDGMHLFEFVLRDFINIEKHSSPASVVVVDDIFPNHPKQARRDRSTQVWTGDVWKFFWCIKEFRPDLLFITLDTSPTGLMVILGLDSENDVLSRHHDEIVARYLSTEWRDPPRSMLERAGALAPNEGFLSRLLTGIATARKSSDQRAALEEWIAQVSESSGSSGA